MARSVQWRRTISDATSWRQDQGLQAVIYIVREVGPTGFLLKEEGDSKPVKVGLILASRNFPFNTLHSDWHGIYGLAPLRNVSFLLARYSLVIRTAAPAPSFGRSETCAVTYVGFC